MAKVGYRSIKEISGPLLFVEGIDNAGYNEMVTIETPDGQIRSGQVLDTRKGMAVVQVFGPTTGIDNKLTVVRFTGEASRISVSDDILGRIFNGLGEPIDQGPAISSSEKLEIVGSSMNPYSREEPS
ncbi:V-type ATP synthase subunit B, partial [mine drainage metagenome]